MQSDVSVTQNNSMSVGHMRVYPKVSRLAACKLYSSLPLGVVVSFFFWVSLVNFAAITLFVASQREFIIIIIIIYLFISLSTQYGNFWIFPRMRYFGHRFRISANVLIPASTGIQRDQTKVGKCTVPTVKYNVSFLCSNFIQYFTCRPMCQTLKIFFLKEAHLFDQVSAI
jgi:hypothetical protein